MAPLSGKGEGNMKIALPSNERTVDGHFGHCQCFTIFTVDDKNRIVSEEKLTPPPGCGCKSNIIPQLAGMGVSIMLAGNMGSRAVSVLSSAGIKVIRGCVGDVREVVEAWLAGKIDDSGIGCQPHDSGNCPGYSKSPTGRQYGDTTTDARIRQTQCQLRSKDTRLHNRQEGP